MLVVIIELDGLVFVSLSRLGHSKLISLLVTHIQALEIVSLPVLDSKVVLIGQENYYVYYFCIGALKRLGWAFSEVNVSLLV